MDETVWSGQVGQVGSVLTRYRESPQNTERVTNWTLMRIRCIESKGDDLGHHDPMVSLALGAE